MVKADNWQERLVQLKKDGNEDIISIEDEILLQDVFGRKIDKAIKGKKEYRTILKKRFNSGLSIAKQVFYKYVPTGYIETIEYTGSGAYSKKTKKMRLNYFSDLNDYKRGPGTQFFHEHGHLIDDRAGDLSSSEEFSNALKEDYENYRDKLKGKKNLTDREIDNLILDEINDSSKHSISDIIDGITHGQITGSASHTRVNPMYWEDKGNLEREAFAHMYEACFDEQKIKYMHTYFPKSFREFKNILKGAI